MRFPVRSYAWLVTTIVVPFAVASGACSLNESGLGGTDASAVAGTTGRGGGGGGTTGGGGGAPVDAAAGAGGTGTGGLTGVAGAGGTTGAGGAPGGTSGTAGTAGTMGTAGAGGTTGLGGTTGPGGQSGGGGTGVAGTTGVAGAGGTTGIAGAGGTTGAAGTTGVAGAGGVTGLAGRGGTTGTAGAGGTGVSTCNALTCMTGCCREGQCVTSTSNQACGMGGAQCRACGPCFRCGRGGCEPIPTARWTVTCVSAMIAPTKPGGAIWDTTSSSTPGTWPDNVCEMSVDGDDSRSTPAVNDTLSPTWNANVTPSDGPDITSSFLMSPDMRWQITIIDQDVQMAHDEVCQVSPRLTAEDLERGTLTLSSGSCTQLNLAFTCSSSN